MSTKVLVKKCIALNCDEEFTGRPERSYCDKHTKGQSNRYIFTDEQLREFGDEMRGKNIGK